MPNESRPEPHESDAQHRQIHKDTVVGDKVAGSKFEFKEIHNSTIILNAIFQHEENIQRHVEAVLDARASRWRPP